MGTGTSFEWCLPVVTYVFVLVISVDGERAELIIVLELASIWPGSTEVLGCQLCDWRASSVARQGSRRRLILGV